jgi:hypothetical protein
MKSRRLTQPRELRTKFRLFSVNAEPHSTCRVPGVDILALGYLCEVRLEGARMVRARVDVDFDA